MKHTADPTPVDLVHGDRYGAIPVLAPELLPPLPRWRYSIFNTLKTFIWFTVIPVNRLMNLAVPPAHTPNYEIRAEQYLSLPLTGMANMGAVFCIAILAKFCGLDPVLSGLLAGFCYHLLFGHIHLEGLSDTIDALHAYPRKDPLTVLTEPHTGALGARYSGTANALTAILIACLVSLMFKHNTSVAMLGAILIAGLVRIMPIYIVLRYYDKLHPGGSAAIGANTRAAISKLRWAAYIWIASAFIPTIGVTVIYQDWRAPAILLIALLAYFISQVTVVRVMNYLRLVYGDILGAGIVCGEIAGLGILTMILAKGL